MCVAFTASDQSRKHRQWAGMLRGGLCRSRPVSKGPYPHAWTGPHPGAAELHSGAAATPEMLVVGHFQILVGTDIARLESFMENAIVGVCLSDQASGQSGPISRPTRTRQRRRLFNRSSPSRKPTAAKIRRQ